MMERVRGEKAGHRIVILLLQLLCASLLLLLVMGCAGGGGGDSNETENRPQPPQQTPTPTPTTGGGGSSGGQSSDVVGNSPSSARLIQLSSSGSGSFSSSIDSPDDVDFYRITINTSGTYTISTSGSLDTLGDLYTENMSLIQSDDDSSGSGNNFLITANISTGTYYIRVTGFSGSTGPYIISISRSATNDTNTNNNSGAAGTDVGGIGVVSWTLTWSYSGSESVEGPDIDLWVRSPAGYRISGANTSEGNLALDHDDRGGFGPGDGGGPERISFTASITTGIYEYGVRWFRGVSGTVNYTLRLYNGNSIVGTNSGQLSAPTSQPGGFITVAQVTLD